MSISEDYVVVLIDDEISGVASSSGLSVKGVISIDAEEVLEYWLNE